jgi:hypothetical protein
VYAAKGWNDAVGNDGREARVNDLAAAGILFSPTGGGCEKNQHGEQSDEPHSKPPEESELYRFRVLATVTPRREMTVVPDRYSWFENRG